MSRTGFVSMHAITHLNHRGHIFKRETFQVDIWTRQLPVLRPDLPQVFLIVHGS